MSATSQLVGTDQQPAGLSTAPTDAGFLAGKWASRVGWLLTILPAALMTVSGAMKVSQQPMVVEMMTTKFGFPAASVRPIGLLELCCTVLLLVPQTAALGAILVAAYLGGAVATHVRASDPFAGPVLFGVLAWAGLWLRDARVRALLPLRR
jgi:hypothetical protein